MIARRVAATALVLAAVAAGASATPAPAPPPTASIRFLVKGDWGTGSAAQAAVTRRMCAEAHRSPVAFIATTGDNFYDPNGTATLSNYWRPERCLRALHIPWRAAWGNHDLPGTSTADVLGARNHYYAVGRGPVRLVVLDGNAPTDPAQLRFLRRQLSRTAEPVRIVAFHQPVFTAGLHAPAEDAQRLWVPLFRRYHVALVLQGHNHLYEHLSLDGVTYVTTGGGGATLYPCLRPAPGLLKCVAANHFLAVTASASAVSVRAIAPNGTTIDRIRIPVTG